MKIIDLINELGVMNHDADVIIFSAGKNYPILGTQILDDGTIEIGCGWAEIENDENN